MQKRRDVFQAVADPTRREILQLLTSKELNLNAIAENFNSSRPTISIHIKLLEECGLLRIEKRGRQRYCKINPEPLKEVSIWINDFKTLWESRLDSMEAYIEDIQKKQDEGI